MKDTEQHRMGTGRSGITGNLYRRMQRKNMFALFTFMLCMFSSIAATASAGAPPWLEEGLYATGKYNTVTAVVGLILLGLAFWLVAMDRRLTKLEKKISHPAGDPRTSMNP